jgi:hypothetical protein
MYVRVSRGRYRPSRFEDVRRLAEERLVPNLRAMPGFRGFTGAVDPATGLLVALSYWDTAEQAAAVGPQRAAFEALGVRLGDAELYEVVVQG